MSCILMIGPEGTDPPLPTLSQYLQTQGHALEALTMNGSALSKELLPTVKRCQPDLILMDAITAANSDLQPSCTQLKADPETGLIPFLLVSEKDSPTEEARNHWLSWGVDEVLNVSEDRENSLRHLQLVIRLNQELKQASDFSKQMADMNAELYERNCQVEKELYVARQLQQSLLPAYIEEDDAPPEPTYTEEELILNPELAAQAVSKMAKCHHKDPRFRVTGIYMPCDALGGDLYDVLPFKDGALGIAVADVSGHGVPAGFVTAIFKASLYRATLNYTTPGDILYHINNELSDIVKTGDYVTGVYCRASADSSVLEYSGAGHPYPMLYRAATQTLERLTENGTPLVWIPNMDYPVGSVNLDPGDKIFIFTDGISEINNCKDEMFGEDALEELFVEAIQQAQQADAQEILDYIMIKVSDFTQGYPLQDDISMVLIEAR